jgi:outer membrane receptor protein involved in Fe transport
MRRVYLELCALVACSALAAATPSLAEETAKQQAAAPADGTDVKSNAPAPRESIEEITVTGSYIKRPRTDGPQSVEVVGLAQIEALGVQSAVDVLEKLNVNAGSEFRSDAFKAGGQYGTANVNLRGLGLGTTLVLVDGRRQVLSGVVSNDGSSFVDINNIPLAMIERVEVLKEGAAATYGSDAVAGVVNFITKRDFTGFELKTQYQSTTQSQQVEQGVSGLVGFGNEVTNFQVFVNYFDSNPLESEERSFTQALRGGDGRFLANSPFGSSTLGNPGALRLRNDPANPRPNQPGPTIRDPLCEAAGGVNAAGGRCGYEFADNFNLAEDEKRTKYGAVFRHEFSDALQLTLKGNFAHNTIDDVGQSPSFPPSTQFVVPASNPGNFLGAEALFVGRPRGELGGTRRFDYDYKTFRYELDLTGDLNDTWTWDTNLSYARSIRDANVGDTLRSEFALALAGYGGPNCRFTPQDDDNLAGNLNRLDVAGRIPDPTRSQAGVGDCKFFVPGSKGLLDPAFINSGEVIDAFNGRLREDTATGLLVADGVVSGTLMQLPAGPLGLALGYQFRRETYDVSRNADSVRTDRFIFLAGGSEFNSDRNVQALFSELNIPLLDNLELQAAIRFEDYNDDSGSSVDPKLAFKWQAAEWLGVRGSFSTTFRAPTLNQQLSERTENEVISDIANVGFLPIDNRGNAFLSPEEADVYNFGLQFTPNDRFTAELDYFRIDFTDLVVSENAQNIVDAERAPNKARGIDGKCDDPNFIASDQVFRDPRFKTDTGVCPISRIEARFVNQDAVLTDGIDLNMTYQLDVPGLDGFSLTTNLTHLIQYDIQTDSGTVKGAGSRNERSSARALPKWRANIGFLAQRGSHSGGLTWRYISSYDDDDRRMGFGKRIDDDTTWDLYYAYEFSQLNATLQVGMFDIFNNEPPFVNTDFNFDSRTHDARGRRVYANLTYRY